MLVPVVGVVAGLALLTYAADQFVAGAVRIAAALRLSAIAIGAVVIGFGTSAPEIVVSASAAAQGSLDIAAGNIVGSTVANLSLVLGVAAMVAPIAVGSSVLRREAPLSLALTLVFAILVQGGLSRWNGALLGALLVAALAWTLRSARGTGAGDDDALTGGVDEFLGDEPPSLPREWMRTLMGLIGTLVAAQVLVASATTIAAEVGLAEGFVGLTVVAIGTSLPELATAVQAARKGETDLIVGNLLGSNLFNAGAVGGLAGLIGPGPLRDPTIVAFATVLMLGVSVVATAFMVTGRRVARREAAVLLAGYLVCVPLLAGVG